MKALYEREIQVKCPKCAYERKPTDQTPHYECPGCGIVYAKYKPTSEPAAAQAGSITKLFRSKFLAHIAVTAIALLVGAVFGWNYAVLIGIAALAVWLVIKAAEGSRKQEQERQAAFEQQPIQHCMTCGHDFKRSSSALRGSGTMEIALWILLLWPIAFIYSIWRRLGEGKAKVSCISCASSQVVPATSPAARAHKRALGITD